MKALNDSTVFFRNSFMPFDKATFNLASSPIMYGLSVYTVFQISWNERLSKLYVFRLEDHFRRLQNSARIMDFHDFLEKWDFQQFQKTICNLLSKNNIEEDALVRVYVFVDEQMTGTKVHGLKHSLSAFVYKFEPYLPEKGARLCVSSWRRTPDNAIPSRAKINGSYVNSSLMKNEALLNGFDDAISLDEYGHVAESTVSNIFLVKNAEIITPSSSTDLLEGITRDTVKQLAENIGINCLQKSVDRSELYLVDEVFLSGSSVRITPVISIDNRTVSNGKPGPISNKLAHAYEQASHGRNPEFANWCLEVS